MIPVFKIGDIVIISQDADVSEVYQVGDCEGEIVGMVGEEVLLKLNEPSIGFPSSAFPEVDGLWCWKHDIRLK